MSNQLNFSQQMDEVLKTLGDTRPRLLLHACCGPCSSAVLERLCRYFDITVLYYNPNTWPAEEYHRRGEELERFVAAAHPLGVTVVEDRYDPQEFYSAVAGLENEPERGSRCTVCYRLRMRRAAQYAAEHGFDWFTTTLSISPHKDAKRINAIGQELEHDDIQQQRRQSRALFKYLLCQRRQHARACNAQRRIETLRRKIQLSKRRARKELRQHVQRQTKPQLIGVNL